MATKLTKNDIESVLPPLEKKEAIEQTERFREEYEKSKKQFEELLEKMSQMLKDEPEEKKK